jgi:hypothetical protein
MTAEELQAAGWTVRPVSMYDEEGVEGWEWTSPDDREYVVMGDWNEPPPLPPQFEE